MPKNREVREFKQNNYFKLFGFPGGSAGKASTCNAGDLSSIPGLGRSPGEGNSYPLQYSGLENSMDGVAKSRTQLSGWTELNCEARDFSGKNVEWVAIPFSGASSQPRDRTQASRASSNAGWPLRCWAKGKPNIWYKSEVKVTVTQLCLTICEPMAYTVHGILQARTLEWVAVPFSRGSSQPRDRTQVSCIAGGFFTRKIF